MNDPHTARKGDMRKDPAGAGSNDFMGGAGIWSRPMLLDPFHYFFFHDLCAGLIVWSHMYSKVINTSTVWRIDYPKLGFLKQCSSSVQPQKEKQTILCYCVLL
jgi:hypothetical protein